MDIRIAPSRLTGTVPAIGSKSDAHRLLICAALADGATVLENVLPSDDIESTIGCLRALGAEMTRSDGVCAVNPPAVPAEHPRLDCRESGTTFRFMLPVAAAVCGSASFSGGGRLPERPIGDLIGALENNGVAFSGHRLPFDVSGKLKSGEYVLPGNVSSQYVSGLLIALTAVSGTSRIRLTSPLESAAYAEMTLKTLRRFGAGITVGDDGYAIAGGRRLRTPGKVTVEGDWSNAAFFLASGALGGGVTVTGLDMDSVQGDKEIVDILIRFGADVSIQGGGVTVRPRALHGCNVDLSGIPDMLPILAVVAALAEGESRFYNGARLRLKESDRLSTVCAMINALGGDAKELPDGLIVRGRGLTGGSVDGAGDHRIVMAAAIAAAHGGGETEILGAQAVNKSYPHFFEDFRMLGGKAHVI